jgi:tRNA A-37 threonylcarbamoyl transferase component Bud32
VGGNQRVADASVLDAATALDLRKNELAFPTRPGETIVLGKLWPDGREEVVLKIPDDSTLTPGLKTTGTHIMRVGPETVAIAKVLTLAPKHNPDGATGVLVISQDVSVAPLSQRLAAMPYPTRVELSGQKLLAGTSEPAPGKPVREVSMSGVHGKDMRLIAEVPPGERSMAMLAGAAGSALLGLVLAALLWRRRPATPAPASATEVSLGTAPTALSASAASSSALPRQPARPSAAMEAGRFGRYALGKQLGAGGMAEVFLARVAGEAGFEKRVAIKIMHSQLTGDDRAVNLFLDEARLVSGLNHPNIVQITDLGREGEAYFIAMEYIDGADLDRLLALEKARGQLVPLREALTIIRRVCDGLHAAHEARDEAGAPLELVHRDVKAENVLISRSGAVKVGDFGIAKANQQVHKTTMGELKGTAAYMAPEHRTGQAVDRRADLYGVGAIAYRVLTGQEINLDLAMLAHLGKQGWPHLPPPSQLRPELPTALDAVIFKALAYEKEDRYPTCAAFEEALDKVADVLGVQASDKGVAQWVTGLLATAAQPAASAAKG